MPADRMDRLPPQNIEVERGLLGSILLDSATALPEAQEFVEPEDFYRSSHGLVFRRILDLAERGSPVDALTLSEEMQGRGEWEKIGGDDLVGEIIQQTPHSANARYYAQIVRAKSDQRRMIEAATAVLQRCYGNDTPIDQMMSESEQAILSVSGRAWGSKSVDCADLSRMAMETIGRRMLGGLPGESTGLDAVDLYTGGWKPGSLTVLAARPSMGKTAAALQLAASLAVDRRKPVLFVSLEMTAGELGERLILSRSGVSQINRKMEEGYFVNAGDAQVKRDFESVCRAETEMKVHGRLLIEDQPTSIGKVSSVIRRAASRHDLGLVVVDYLQLLSPSDDRVSRQEQVSQMSREFKELARYTQKPILLLSQLNRENEKRAEKRPVMADLRESGAIEQDADVVILLHRPDYYNASDQPGLCEWVVAKNRNGRTGLARLRFTKDPQIFSTWDSIVDSSGDNTPF